MPSNFIQFSQYIIRKDLVHYSIFPACFWIFIYLNAAFMFSRHFYTAIFFHNQWSEFYLQTFKKLVKHDYDNGQKRLGNPFQKWFITFPSSPSLNTVFFWLLVLGISSLFLILPTTTVGKDLKEWVVSEIWLVPTLWRPCLAHTSGTP